MDRKWQCILLFCMEVMLSVCLDGSAEDYSSQTTSYCFHEQLGHTSSCSSNWLTSAAPWPTYLLSSSQQCTCSRMVLRTCMQFSCVPHRQQQLQVRRNCCMLQGGFCDQHTTGATVCSYSAAVADQGVFCLLCWLTCRWACQAAARRLYATRSSATLTGETLTYLPTYLVTGLVATHWVVVAFTSPLNC
jgi:hypothetical protein